MLKQNTLIIKLILEINKITLTVINMKLIVDFNIIWLINRIIMANPKTIAKIGLGMHTIPFKSAPILVAINPDSFAHEQKLIENSLINIILVPQLSLAFPSIMLKGTLINLMRIDLSAVEMLYTVLKLANVVDSVGTQDTVAMKFV